MPYQDIFNQSVRPPIDPAEMQSRYLQLQNLAQRNQVQQQQIADLPVQRQRDQQVFQGQVDAQQRQKAMQMLDFMENESAALVQTPDAQLQQAWDLTLQRGQQLGMDMSTVPKQADRNYAQQVYQRSKEFRQHIAQQEQQRVAQEAKPPSTLDTDKGIMQWSPTAKNWQDTGFKKPVPPKVPVPGRDVPYPADVEAQQRRVNASRAQVNGLTPGQLTKVTQLASQFDSNPSVKNYNEQVNKAEGVKRIIEGGLGGPGDLATVFEFMKALDPTSVVRESEYAAAAKSGNIFSGTMAKFNGAFKPQGGLLSDQVKKDFLGILDRKLAVSQSQVKKMHGDFARRIDHITGQKDGAEYLTDYGSIYGQEAQSAPAPAQGGAPMYATNPKTKERIMSLDGGKSWQPAK